MLTHYIKRLDFVLYICAMFEDIYFPFVARSISFVIYQPMFVMYVLESFHETIPTTELLKSYCSSSYSRNWPNDNLL